MSKKYFNSIVDEATHAMPLYRRLFSKLIHIRAVAAASDILASTVGRPNALLAGAIASFIFTLPLYLLAKNYGYALSGFEPIISFVAGWLAGMISDTVTFILRKK